MLRLSTEKKAIRKKEVLFRSLNEQDRTKLIEIDEVEKRMGRLRVALEGNMKQVKAWDKVRGQTVERTTAASGRSRQPSLLETTLSDSHRQELSRESVTSNKASRDGGSTGGSADRSKPQIGLGFSRMLRQFDSKD